MDAEIIAVGSELLTPARIDTNSLYLTGKLNALGVEVVAKTIVGDDRDRLREAVRLAAGRSQIVILTGGLGPTEDDVTRDAVAAALGRQQQLRPEIVAWIEQRFARMKRKMAEINQRQAFVIEGAEVLPNDRGTAPGQWIECEPAPRVVMLLPGPPRELEPMFESLCVPRLERLLPPQVIRTLHFRAAGITESDLDQLIAPVYTKYSNPVTTILAAPGDIQIFLRARCASQAEAEALNAEVGPQIAALLGDRIYSRNGDPLEAVVGNLLRERGATLSVAESATGGMLAARITSIPGSSDYFSGGFLVYNDRMKHELLGVDAKLLEKYTAVSEPVAEAMAVGARRATGSTYALSITGVAGPGGGTEAAPVGTVFIGLAGPTDCHVHRSRFIGDRERVRALAAQTALNLLRKKLAGG
jgi:nicotinamide-nucleotide amidase